jgi:hypothetical protein
MVVSVPSTHAILTDDLDLTDDPGELGGARDVVELGGLR